jgi:hypothetical protein
MISTKVIYLGHSASSALGVFFHDSDRHISGKDIDSRKLMSHVHGMKIKPSTIRIVPAYANTRSDGNCGAGWWMVEPQWYLLNIAAGMSLLDSKTISSQTKKGPKAKKEEVKCFLLGTMHLKDGRDGKKHMLSHNMWKVVKIKGSTGRVIEEKRWVLGEDSEAKSKAFKYYKEI